MVRNSAKPCARIYGSTNLPEGDDLVAALTPVANAFKTLDVRYYVGGSVASSYHGAVRSTMDVDLVCELTANLVTQFISLVGVNYYLSEPTIRDAVNRQSCFNLIHLPTSYKVDVFISRGRPFDHQAFTRARTGSLGLHACVEVPVATPEDIVISKLEWYRLTNETSERQWDDVGRVLRLTGEQADLAYLRDVAESVGVSDLLERALGEQST